MPRSSAAASGWRSGRRRGGSNARHNEIFLPDVTRIYTPELANRSLPLVRRIVEDIVGQFARWQTRVREFEIVSASNSMSDPDPRAEELERDVASLAAELEHFHQELTALGVEFKDYALGLVDFPAEMDGRPIELCWRLGEPTVAYWHERDAGYAGRQPLMPKAVIGG